MEDVLYNPQIVIQMDASKTGWGPSCQGLTTRGVWSKQERSFHINVLELLAVKLALLSFTKNRKVTAIHFQIDNTTALRYLTKMGGVKPLEMIKLNKEIWDYLLSRGITITTEYLPSKLNITADRDSREKVDSSEWKLDPGVFQGLVQLIENQPSGRFVCISTKSSITPVHNLETGSIQSGHRCNASGLVSVLPVCLSPLLPYKLKVRQERMPSILLITPT